MPRYKITVIQLVADEDLHKAIDLEESPKGTHLWEADDMSDALDQFHLVVPIACLDDFDISIKLIGPGQPDRPTHPLGVK
jgi:hypothetical protein